MPPSSSPSQLLRILRSQQRPQLPSTVKQNLSKRWQATDATTAATAETQQSAFQKFYNSPVGPKTVHFWAPVMKWGVVLAGVADFARPAEKLSLQQNVALTATGLIWTRWCLIIKPRNILLASVNFLLGCVGIVQVSRVLAYQNSVKGQSTTDAVVEGVKDVKESVVEGAKEGGAKAKALIQ